MSERDPVVPDTERVTLYRHPDGGTWRMMDPPELKMADHEYVESCEFVPASELAETEKAAQDAAEALESTEQELAEANARVERLRGLIDCEERDFDLEARYAAAESALARVKRLIEGEGWGDDAADEWWKDSLRAALSEQERCPTCDCEFRFAHCSDPWHDEQDKRKITWQRGLTTFNPAGSPTVRKSERCPTCGSADPQRCNVKGWGAYCPDPFHEQDKGEG